MALNPQQLPRQIVSDPALGDNSRAAQNIFSSMPRFAATVFELPYLEPMILAVDEEPLGIELLRIIDLRAPEAPVLCGSMVHFVYRPELGGAQIWSIDGLSPDPASTYRFTFRITYKAQI